MLPIVDTNWYLNNDDQNTADFHVLRAVVVQPKQSHSDSLVDLRRLTARAETPGSGGLPHAVIPYCDLTNENALEILKVLSSDDKVKGVSYELDRSEISALTKSLDYLTRNKLSLDIVCNASMIGHVANIAAQYPTLTIVLNVNQIEFNETHSDLHNCIARFRPLLIHKNVFVKLAGCYTKNSTELEQKLSEFLEALTRLIGMDRLILASGSATTSTLTSERSLWSYYSSATHWVSANGRNKLFRANAMHVYRLS